MPSNDVVIRSAILATFRDLAERRGLDCHGLLEEAGLPRNALDNPETELPLNSVASLMELAAERADDPSLGLTLAEAHHPGASGLVDYIALHASTVGESLQAIVDYSGLICHPSPLQLRKKRDSLALSWSFPTVKGTRRVQFASFINAVIVLRLRHLAGRQWSPLAVEVEHPELPCPAMVRRIFGRRITFNARQNQILIDRKTAGQAIRGADPNLFRILREFGDVKLREISARSDFVTRTARAITETLDTHPPLLEHVAERMRMTPRTLQSRLAQHGTTFEKVLSDTRRALAERYLRDTQLQLTEIAYLLGFSEQSAFTRAARSWFGRPPRQLRKESFQPARNGNGHSG
jgi:AraC-like DNA-binding protein